MRHLTKYALASLLAALFLFSGCGNREKISRQPKSKILVIHCYDSLFRNYRTYDRVFAKSLEKEGVNAEIRNIYHAGINFTARDGHRQALTSLKDSKWIPDVICFFDDRTLQRHFNNVFQKFFPYQDSIPVVAAGIHDPNYKLLRNHKNLALMVDPVNFRENIDLAREISGFNNIDIELGYSDYDMSLRSKLDNAISRPPYVNNADFHIENPAETAETPEYQDSVIVNVFSNSNLKYPLRQGERKKFRRMILQDIHRAAILQVKKDIESDDLISAASSPQFTAIRDGFADGSGTLLCGLFASYETVAKDQASYVARVLFGESPSSLPVATHKDELYMDWQAMKALGLKCSDYKSRFTIVGAPFHRRHLFLFCVLILLAGTLITGAIYHLAQLMFRKSRAKLRETTDLLETERDLFNVALQGSDYRVINGYDDYLKLKPDIHPSDIDRYSSILANGGEERREVDFRMKDGDGYRWWKMRCNSSGAEGEDIYGILIDINESMIHNEALAEAAIVAQEITEKEDFMRNISHEIRTPLNTIIGYSEVLATDGDNLTETDLEEINTYIINAASSLSDMIEDILVFSKFESGKLDISPRDTSVGELVRSIWRKWKSEVPEGIELTLMQGRENVYANIDPVRMTTIVEAYLKNAIKFTGKGVVTLGWYYFLDKGTVKIFVEDTGPGIEPKHQEYAFHFFWKADQFKSGVGLGLSIARFLTEAMNGEVGMETEYGSGSCFSSSFKATVRK